MKPSRTAMYARYLLNQVADVEVSSSGTADAVSFPDTSLPSAVFRKEYLAYNMLRKRDLGEVSPDMMRASLTKWAAAEHTCSVINTHGHFWSPLGDTKAIFNTITRRVVANLSRLLMDVWPDYSSFTATNGATKAHSRQFSMAASKLCAKALVEPRDGNRSFTCSTAQYPYFLHVLESFETLKAKLGSARVIQDTPAQLGFVPKDASSVRLTQKSGAFTISLQKLFGDAIRTALLKENININDQTINQEWAEIGSLTGLVATVDLSSASDSIALRHLDLFPKRWATYFRDLRDRSVTVGTNSSVYKLQMVASMGNGFIFELQTALFWAIARSVVEVYGGNVDFISVYGDDIILPSSAYDLFCSYMSYQGFTINAQKSYSGSCKFRESCGKHFHNGIDVTPFYIKNDVNDPSDHYHLINSVLEWNRLSPDGTTLDVTIVLNGLKHKDRFVVPPTWGLRAGLHAQIDSSCSVPIERYDKALQRYVTVFTKCEFVDSNVNERLPQEILLCEALRTTGVCIVDYANLPLHLMRSFANPLMEKLPVAFGMFGKYKTEIGRAHV